MNTITVQCKQLHPPYMTHVRLEHTGSTLTVKRGFINQHRFYPYETEEIALAENPELLEMFDGKGWNVSEVQLFIEESVPEFDRPELTIAHSTH